jgi:hypothetical protein
VDRAAEHVSNWLDATRAELELLVRALGFTTLTEVRTYCPLVARTQEAARVFGVPFDGATPAAPWGDRVGDLVASYDQMIGILRQIYERWSRHGIQ